VHFACWLADGTLVESSYPTGQPSELVLSMLPSGMREGFLRIPGGAAGWLRIPAAQGYGAKGHQARKVPPDADLVMRVELLGIAR
jgi:FKBP-type peptidyl-prolyl cis-trans isomerase